MVKVDGFQVKILSPSSSDEFEKNGMIYNKLKSGSEYQLKLGNSRDTICDVDVSIDGRYIGTWRIWANSFIILERPLVEERKFTFFSENSSAAKKAGVVPSEDSGLIVATFKPKKYTPVESVHVASSLQPNNLKKSASSFNSGITLLGDRSDQKFYTVEPINPRDIDTENIATIMIRLVAESEYIQIPPLTNKSKTTLYPKRIDPMPITPPTDLFSRPILAK